MTEFEDGQRTALLAMLKLVIAVLTPQQRKFIENQMNAEHKARSGDWDEMTDIERERANDFLHLFTNAFAEIDDMADMFRQNISR